MKFIPKIISDRFSLSRKAISGSETSYNAASRMLRSMRSWNPGLGSPSNDLPENERKTIIARSRDAYRNFTIARAAISRSKSNIIGTGLRLRSEIDWQALNISREEATKLENIIEREWRLWASSPSECDAENTLSFYQLQGLSLVSSMISGDVFALTPFAQRPGCVYGLKLQMIEADRICNQNMLGNSKRLTDGVELDLLGGPITYHIKRSHPLDFYNIDIDNNKWNIVPAFGNKTNRRRVLHIWNEKERPGQTRGVPFLAPILEPLRKLEQYSQAELTGAVISAMFTVFIEHDIPDDFDDIKKPWSDNSNDQAPTAQNEIALGQGAVLDLAPGEKPTTINPTRPNDKYEPFTNAITKEIGAALEIPFEELMLYYSSSYSAARAAMLQAWKFYINRRVFQASQFCQPAFELLFDEAVARGRIPVKNYGDPARFRAYTQAQWIGPKRGAIDELKETRAAELRIKTGVSTIEREAQEISGEDWDTIHIQRVLEREARLRSGLES